MTGRGNMHVMISKVGLMIGCNTSACSAAHQRAALHVNGRHIMV